MPYNTLKVLSWNTRGFGTEGRRRIVRDFIKRAYKDIDIIALQELKVTDRRRLEMSLRALMPEGRIVVDYTPSGKRGCALLISSKLRVSEVGTSQFGGAAWATVHAASGSIRVASLHAPNSKEERQVYWNWWDHQVDGEDWLIAGDFNNVELQEDSKGKSALMRGAEERAWKRFTYRTDMVDAYLAPTKIEGGLYTRLAFSLGKVTLLARKAHRHTVDPTSSSGVYTLIPGINKGGIQELERISRQFLWGWTDTGKGKKSLLAWEVFSKPKKEGGLGWGQLQTMVEWEKADVIRTFRLLKRANFSTGLLLQNGDGSRSSFLQFLEESNVPIMPQESQLLLKLDREFPPRMARNIALHESDGWIWEGPALHIASTWTPPTPAATGDDMGRH
ncbi:hypothetical protein R1sor_027314 [Riccia sorocarpa]|uniref:Endonuclease/exonuclease/phosphatase domain-containing protein n=1 Tax=Riccia sorocarpa TaxID=122646 RepID=A0ABD3GHI6_9MARC